jgi:hypothetical protein
MNVSTADTRSTRPDFFIPRPTDRMSTSRSRHGVVTLKEKKGILGSMTDLFNLNKRPEISTPHDPLHRTHVVSDPSTNKFIGLPEDWQPRSEGSGISESDQEKAVMEIVPANSLLEKTELYYDTLLGARADKRQQEIGELKENIDDLKDEMALKEVKWAIRERQLTM